MSLFHGDSLCLGATHYGTSMLSSSDPPTDTGRLPGYAPGFASSSTSTDLNLPSSNENGTRRNIVFLIQDCFTLFIQPQALSRLVNPHYFASYFPQTMRLAIGHMSAIYANCRSVLVAHLDVTLPLDEVVILSSVCLSTTSQGHLRSGCQRMATLSRY
jgi:hypothetical protein